MNLAVAREIPGCENLDYQYYKQVVDKWADDVRNHLTIAEANFRKAPQLWRNDINFCRLGALATYLTRRVGVRYAKKYSQEQKAGKNSKYKEPGAVLVHGLIDDLHGTCANMPVLYVAIARRLGWPVSLACVGPHFVCRYDDGKVHHNIETTYTGSGFVEETDQEYMKDVKLPQKAATTGSDFRSLSGREMLGVFIGLRARYYWDTEQFDAAERDYCLARALFPNHRYCFRESIRAIVWRGEQLFEPYETGHPATMAAWLASTYLQPVDQAVSRARIAPSSPGARIPVAYPQLQRYSPPAMDEVNRINTVNRARTERVLRPETMPQPQSPTVPGTPRPPGRYR
ncbi:MAG TPA: transglutaminase family protein [Phycisphaerae bacterium]|nr:transglutaminase family protein [Phycisphaerae bacterium]